MKCICGKPIELPGFFVGYAANKVPMCLHYCSCGMVNQAAIETMAPYTAKRSEAFPPMRGNYFVGIPVEDNDPACQKPLFMCPVCQGLSPIAAPTHTVSDAGEVTPSVVCPYGCGFHTHMTLEGWKAE